MTDSLMKKLEKIYALATRGVAGEMESAKRKLAQLMGEHGLTIDDIKAQVEDKQYYEFPYFDKLEKSLLIQIYCKEMNVHAMAYSKFQDRKRRLTIQLTPSQHERISKRYKLLKRALRAELKQILAATQAAFFSKNSLYSEPDPDREPEEPGFDIEVFSMLFNNMNPVADPNAQRIS